MTEFELLQDKVKLQHEIIGTLKESIENQDEIIELLYQRVVMLSKRPTIKQVCKIHDN